MRPFQTAAIKSSLLTTRSRLRGDIADVEGLWLDVNGLSVATKLATSKIKRVVRKLVDHGEAQPMEKQDFGRLNICTALWSAHNPEPTSLTVSFWQSGFAHPFRPYRELLRTAKRLQGRQI